MLGEALRLIAVAQGLQPGEMIPVERLHGADGEADAVKRKRMVLAQPAKLGMWRAARAHVVFRVDLEEADLLRLDEDIGEMLGFEAGTGTARQGGRDHGGTFLKKCNGAGVAPSGGQARRQAGAGPA